MAITISNPFDWVHQFFTNKITDRQLDEWRNVFFRCVVTSIPPRHETFEYMREIGSSNVEKVLLHQPLRISRKHLAFFFPERVMSTQEEQIFVPMLVTHPEIRAAEMTVIDIVTKSPLLIGNFLKEDIRIVHAGKDGRPMMDDVNVAVTKGLALYNRR